MSTTPHPETSIVKGLNAAQRRAVTSKSQTVAILAGPGSGKTHTLTSRVVWLVQQAGYQPSEIVVATFTVKAAREMKKRIGSALGEECEKRIVLGTFHSISRRYLSTYGKRIGLDSKFGIADDGDSRAIIQRICKRLDLQIEPSYAKSWISKKKAKGSMAAATKTGKQTQETTALKECYRQYQEQLTRSNLLDYDDLLVRCVELLQDHPSCVSNVKAVLIDEYQDTNGIQYELMRLFAQAQERITIVGDPDQSIYGWRSAEIRNLYRLLRDFPQTDEVSLEENYRSSQLILNVSLSVIQQDKKRYQKVLLPVHTKGARPVLRKLKSSAAEGEWIVSEIRRAIMMFGSMLKHEDVAILLRSAALSRHVESALGKAGVAYRMIGGHKFYDRKEIKVLLDYLRVVYQPDNNDAVARVINVPRRGIGERTVKLLLEEAEEAKMSLWAVLSRHCRGERRATTNIRTNMEHKLSGELLKIITNLRKKSQQMDQSSPSTLVELLEQLINQLNFKRYLEEEYTEDHEQRWANVQELLNLAKDFMRDFGKSDEDELPEIANLEQVKDDDVLGRFLTNVALASDAQRDDKDTDKSSLVTISTIHAAKGLEWPVVFVPSVYTGSIPHSRAEDLDEERRLLYVAMTRAQALLYLSCPAYGSQGGSKVELSPFVEPFAQTAFAQKGPSFDRPIIESAAKILGREAPTQQAIYDKVPAMFSPEDDLFPVDPFEAKEPGALDDRGDQYTKASKRQRTSYTDSVDRGAGERPWQPEYATTMEQSSEFTIPSMPGFVSAGAHQSALAAAAAQEALEKPASGKQPMKVGTTSRKPGQRSLLGFVVKETKAPEPAPRIPPANDLAYMRHQRARDRSLALFEEGKRRAREEEQKPAIDPVLAEHKLPSGKILAKPVGIKVEDGASRKQYACFSSPPPRPSSPEKEKQDGIKQEEHTSMSSKLTSIPQGTIQANVKKETGGVGFCSRPVASFHATTFQAARARRPVGLGPAPSMDRLSKPFKPLTINRPTGPPRR